MSEYALGLIETRGLIGVIEATDAAAKAASVVVSSAEYTGGSMMIIRIEGELGAVQAAVEAGARAVERVGELVATHIIANPADGLDPITPTKRYTSKYRPDDDRPPLSFGGAPA
ncbi:MAG: BMC domain-containing protein, partial [candidate division Zixibacteria bacterium]|nr:BMC domain-containing protein [candidate division Zixibacteria bacterium]